MRGTVRGAVHGAVRGAVHGTVRGAVHVAVRGAVHGATSCSRPQPATYNGVRDGRSN